MDAKNWDSKFNQNPIMYSDIGRLWKYIKSSIDEPYSDKVVLDVGCGIGRNSLFFLEKGFFVDAFDYSSTAIQFASKLCQNYLKSKFNINFESINEFNFKKNYDIIIAIAVLHFLSSQREVENFIKNMQDNTSQNGLNIISFPIDYNTNKDEFNTAINHDNILKLYKNKNWNVFEKLTGVTVGADPEGNNARVIFILIAKRL